MLTLESIWQAENQQAQFRLLLEAMARPGSRYTFFEHPDESSVALAVLATLLDAEVSLADPQKRLTDKDWRMLQVRSAELEHADYILHTGMQPSTDLVPKPGTLASPEKSATVILVVDELGQGDMALTLSGPGIKTQQQLIVSGLDAWWLSMRELWNSAFPLGVDFILVDEKQVVALPRTTKVEVV